MTDQIIITPHFINTSYAALKNLNYPGARFLEHDLDGLSDIDALLKSHPALKAEIASVVEQGLRPVSIAGDCCATLPVLAGLQEADMQPVLLWLDAHGDFNTWDTTPSNFLGGMPLAMLAGIGDQQFCENVNLQNLPVADIILCDGRDLDPGEQILVDQSGIHHAKSIAEVDFELFKSRPVWVHFDTDIINLSEMSAVAYPAKGGPSAAELRRFFERLAAEVHIAAISMTTWDPALDPNGDAQRTCLALLEVLRA